MIKSHCCGVCNSLYCTLMDTSLDWECLKGEKIFCYIDVCRSQKSWSDSFNPWNRNISRIYDLNNNIDDDTDYDAGDDVTVVKKSISIKREELHFPSKKPFFCVKCVGFQVAVPRGFIVWISKFTKMLNVCLVCYSTLFVTYLLSLKIIFRKVIWSV